MQSLFLVIMQHTLQQFICFSSFPSKDQLYQGAYFKIGRFFQLIANFKVKQYFSDCN